MISRVNWKKNTNKSSGLEDELDYLGKHMENRKKGSK